MAEKRSGSVSASSITKCRGSGNGAAPATICPIISLHVPRSVILADTGENHGPLSANDSAQTALAQQANIHEGAFWRAVGQARQQLMTSNYSRQRARDCLNAFCTSSVVLSLKNSGALGTALCRASRPYSLRTAKEPASLRADFGRPYWPPPETLS